MRIALQPATVLQLLRWMAESAGMDHQGKLRVLVLMPINVCQVGSANVSKLGAECKASTQSLCKPLMRIREVQMTAATHGLLHYSTC